MFVYLQVTANRWTILEDDDYAEMAAVEVHNVFTALYLNSFSGFWWKFVVGV